jgi:hypothetical protein
MHTTKSLLRLAAVAALGATGALAPLVAVGTASAKAPTKQQAKQLSKELKSLTTHVSAANHTTFKAVYASVDDGQSQTITFEQKPPATLFSDGSGAVLSTGKKTYLCSTEAGTKSCISESGANPLAGLEEIFTPVYTVNILKAAEAEIAARAGNYHVSFSTKSYAGVSSTCASITAQGHTDIYCVGKSGMLTYEAGPGESFTLTSYSSSPPASDFAVPASATTVTIPTIPSTP